MKVWKLYMRLYTVFDTVSQLMDHRENHGEIRTSEIIKGEKSQ